MTKKTIAFQFSQLFPKKKRILLKKTTIISTKQESDVGQKIEREREGQQ